MINSSQYESHCLIILSCLLLGLQRRRLIPALTLDSASSPTHRSSKQTTSSSSSSSSPGACWVDGPLGPPASLNLRGAGATAETFEIKVYEIDDVERLQKRKEKKGNKVSSHRHGKRRKWRWWCLKVKNKEIIEKAYVEIKAVELWDELSGQS